jgi:proline iminopeptidase
MSMKVRVRALTAVLLYTACSASHLGPGAVREGELPRAGRGNLVGAGGVQLLYRLEGAGADTIVVLHGGPGFSLEGLRPDLRPLSQRHALLYFDQRGSGHSDMPDTLQLTAALMVEDVEAVRRTFRIDRLTLFGHSWGGGLAVLYAARYPDRVRRLILVAPIAPRKHPYSDQYVANQVARHDSAEKARMAVLDSTWAAAPGQYSVCREGTRLFLRGVAATPEAAGRIKADLCSGTMLNRRLVDVLQRRVGASLAADGNPDGPYDWRPLARRVAAPILIVHGDKDPLPLAGSEEWARVLPHARLVVIPGAGHYPHAERPELFFPAVEEFLAEEPP